jgi:hypothetical protein
VDHYNSDKVPFLFEQTSSAWRLCLLSHRPGCCGLASARRTSDEVHCPSFPSRSGQGARALIFPSPEHGDIIQVAGPASASRTSNELHGPSFPSRRSGLGTRELIFPAHRDIIQVADLQPTALEHCSCILQGIFRPGSTVSTPALGAALFLEK